ncbi:MAG: iron-containing redox enzyme family protein [Nitrospirae bacterium]|nr:MAG: iron-containing redox enzyme family protein [Nitrospirota bacterium]
MGFYHEMRRIVLSHKAVNNPYLERFQKGDLTDKGLRDFAIEFYNFARFFPKILVSQLVNTEDEYVAEELTKVLYSELGDGHPQQRHERLYRQFLYSLGIDVHEAIIRPMLPSTQAYITGMERLYSDMNHFKALGASFGLEHMAVRMWDQLIPGLLRLQKTRYPTMDITYFTFHRQLESTHEDAMAHAVAAVEQLSAAGMSAQDQADFRQGMQAVLDYLEGFWMGLEGQYSSPGVPSPVGDGIGQAR